MLGLFFLCYAAIYFVARSDWFRLRIQSELSKNTGYEIRMETLRLTPWLSLAASGLFVSKNGEVLFQGKRIVCFLLPWDFFHGRIRRLSLEQPELRLSLEDLFSPSGETSLNLSIGTLNIDDGELVLKTGYGGPFALRSIFLNAKNVNLGGETGLQLRTYIPAVSGSAALSISGGPVEKRAEVVLHQGEENLLTRLLPKTAKEKPVFKAVFQMKRKDSDAYEVKGSGGADQFRLGTEKIGGEFNAVVQLDAKAKTALFSVDLKMPQLPAKLLPTEIPLNPGAVSATIRGDYSTAQNTLTLQNIEVASSTGTSLEGRGAISLGEKPVKLNTTLRLRNAGLDEIMALMPKPLSDFAYTGKASADIHLTGAYNDPVISGVAWNDQGKAQGNNLAVAQMALRVPFRWANSLLEIKAAQFRGKNLIWGQKEKTQFKIQEASLFGDIVKEPQRPLRMATDFQIVEGGFSVPGESKAGERLRVKGRFACQDCAGNASFNGEANVESLELLWNKFFGDFKDQKLSIQVEGSYRREAEELRFNQLHVALGSGGHLNLKGSVRLPASKPTFDLEVQSDDLRHAALYDFFIRDTFKATYPLLGQIGLAGKSAVAIRTQGSLDSFTAEGRLHMEQGEIREKSDRWRVGPIALDLPVRLRYPQALAEKPGELPPIGKLSMGGIKALSTAIPKIDIPLVLWNNSLRFPQPIRISLFGGTAVIEDLAWKDVVGAPMDLSFSLGLSDLGLLELTESLGWYRFGGTLSGSIPQVHWAGDSLKSDGTITLNVFGGRATIRGMAVEKPFSPVRSITMDARLEGLNLEQASETFEFGRISGVLAGAIENLVMTQGQPAEFRADIRSVETPGVSQWISVEALDKITVLSSGNEAGAVYGGIAGFFDFFRYSKLGFKAALKNDKLMLRGIETKNGQEYLVVGTLLPPTVNIVSHTQEIGFSELMGRLKRIQGTGSSESIGPSMGR